MIRSTLLATLAASTVAATPAGAAGPTRVPPAFLGEWRHEVSACGSSGDDSILTVRPNRLEFWESAGAIVAVTVHSPREITVRARMSGEGETWETVLRFRLSSDGEGLADVTEGEAEPFIRRRCPKR